MVRVQLSGESCDVELHKVRDDITGLICQLIFIGYILLDLFSKSTLYLIRKYSVRSEYLTLLRCL